MPSSAAASLWGVPSVLPNFNPAAVARFHLDLQRGHLAKCYELPAKRRPVRLRWYHLALLPVALVLLAAECVLERIGL